MNKTSIFLNIAIIVIYLYFGGMNSILKITKDLYETDMNDSPIAPKIFLTLILIIFILFVYIKIDEYISKKYPKKTK